MQAYLASARMDLNVVLRERQPMSAVLILLLVLTGRIGLNLINLAVSIFPQDDGDRKMASA